MLDEKYTVKWRPANARMKNKRLNGVQQMLDAKYTFNWLSAIFFMENKCLFFCQTKIVGLKYVFIVA
jgi:hypothetical protein